ncbi:MAG: cytochrome P450 [Chloroflexi bacterium]|nr:cytochrome P450 [Chloroflexota bacterium]MBP8058534.1 cytochrome P450 [Chloroflexota bacterium]
MTETIIWERGRNNAPLPPKVPGLPLLGSALDFLYRPIELFLDAYHRFGPIFRIQAANQQFVVLAGLEANRFMAHVGEEFLSSEPLFGEFAQQMGSPNFLVAIDGPPHRHMRKVMQRGYSKGGIAPHLDHFAQLTYERAAQWRAGETILVRDQLQRLVTEQLGLALTNHSSGDHFDAIRIYLSTLLNVLTIKRWPRFMLHMPRYRNAKRQVMAMARQVVDAHRASSEGRAPDLIDDLLTAQDWEGNPLLEDDILAATVGPFFAGMDTVANTMGFMVYAILKHPDVLARILPEVDEHFAHGVPPWRELPQMKALYGATIETLRRYPVAPFTPRGVVTPFTFAGYQVEAGQQVIIANGLTHFLPEFFPEPFTFDIDRYAPPRNEHRQGTGVFAPYTLGPHTCLGAGAAEVQLMVTVGALLRAVRLELDPAHYEIKTKLTPIPSPDPKFRVRVVESRL